MRRYIPFIFIIVISLSVLVYSQGSEPSDEFKKFSDSPTFENFESLEEYHTVDQFRTLDVETQHELFENSLGKMGEFKSKYPEIATRYFSEYGTHNKAVTLEYLKTFHEGISFGEGFTDSEFGSIGFKIEGNTIFNGDASIDLNTVGEDFQITILKDKGFKLTRNSKDGQEKLLDLNLKSGKVEKFNEDGSVDVNVNGRLVKIVKGSGEVDEKSILLKPLDGKSGALAHVYDPNNLNNPIAIFTAVSKPLRVFIISEDGFSPEATESIAVFDTRVNSITYARAIKESVFFVDNLGHLMKFKHDEGTHVLLSTSATKAKSLTGPKGEVSFFTENDAKYTLEPKKYEFERPDGEKISLGAYNAITIKRTEINPATGKEITSDSSIKLIKKDGKHEFTITMSSDGYYELFKVTDEGLENMPLTEPTKRLAWLLEWYEDKTGLSGEDIEKLKEVFPPPKVVEVYEGTTSGDGKLGGSFGDLLGGQHWPTSPFGYRVKPTPGASTYHAGQDLAAAGGTPIKAAGSGTIIFSGWQPGYGNTVIIDHGNGVTTLYGHCQSLFVNKGDPVNKGEEIAGVGKTGTATGNHLHFEVRHNGNAIDPRTYFTP